MTTCSQQPLKNQAAVIAFPSDHLFSFEKLTRQLSSNLYCNYVWLQAFIASQHVPSWLLLLFPLKLCPAIIVIWWWHPSVGQVVNMEPYFLLWMWNSSDFSLKYESKLETGWLWNSNIIIRHRKCLDVDVMLRIDANIRLPALKQSVL